MTAFLRLIAQFIDWHTANDRITVTRICAHRGIIGDVVQGWRIPTTRP